MPHFSHLLYEDNDINFLSVWLHRLSNLIKIMCWEGGLHIYKQAMHVCSCYLFFIAPWGMEELLGPFCVVCMALRTRILPQVTYRDAPFCYIYCPYHGVQSLCMVGSLCFWLFIQLKKKSLIFLGMLPQRNEVRTNCRSDWLSLSFLSIRPWARGTG